jgi:hypothetical protein
MKFLLFGFLGLIALGVIMAVAGGGEDAAPSTTPETTAPATESAAPEAKEEAPAEEPAKVTGIGETLKVGDVTYTVHGRTEAANVGGEYGETAKGKYLVLDVTVKNEGKESLMVDSSLFKLKSGDTVYEADSTASMYANEQADFFLTDLNSGLEMKGNVVFDIPTEAHTAELMLQVQTGMFGTETGLIALQ